MLTDGINSIKEACNSLFPTVQLTDTSARTPRSAASTASDNWFFSADTEELLATDNTEQSRLASNNQVDSEISKLKALLGNASYINAVHSSHKFWRDHGHEMPKLKKLFSILLNIPASSAFIERFFSIAGCVCDVKRGRMDPDLVRCRSLLKTNIKFLNEMKFGQE